MKIPESLVIAIGNERATLSVQEFALQYGAGDLPDDTRVWLEGLSDKWMSASQAISVLRSGSDDPGAETSEEAVPRQHYAPWGYGSISANFEEQILTIKDPIKTTQVVRFCDISRMVAEQHPRPRVTMSKLIAYGIFLPVFYVAFFEMDKFSTGGYTALVITAILISKAVTELFPGKERFTVSLDTSRGQITTTFDGGHLESLETLFKAIEDTRDGRIPSAD